MIKTLANSLSTRKPQKVHIALELLFRVQIVGSSVLPLLSLFLPLSLSLSLCVCLCARDATTFFVVILQKRIQNAVGIVNFKQTFAGISGLPGTSDISSFHH